MSHQLLRHLLAYSLLGLALPLAAAHTDPATCLCGRDGSTQLALPRGELRSHTDAYRTLIEAAQAGDDASVHARCAAGAGVNNVGLHKRNAMIEAAKRGHLRVVRCLWWWGATLEQRDSFEQTALTLAAKGAHEEVVAWLCEKIVLDHLVREVADLASTAQRSAMRVAMKGLQRRCNKRADLLLTHWVRQEGIPSTGERQLTAIFLPWYHKDLEKQVHACKEELDRCRRKPRSSARVCPPQGVAWGREQLLP